MQRADLTVYEQVQGFQMMLDLGETQDGIAEKTGFSKTTIRHRLKLLELDPEEFQKAQERQATFSDYIELEKLKNPESKTEALKVIGTSNFKYTVERLISRENAGANAEKAKAFLDSKLKKVNFDNRFQYRQIGSMPISRAFSEDWQKELDKYIAKGAKYYTLSSDEPEFAWAYIYTDPVIESEEDRAAKQKRDELENVRRKREQKIREEEQRARDLRKRFVKEFANREYISTLIEAILTEPGLDDTDYGEVAELLGIDGKYNGYNELDLFLKSLDYKTYVKRHPESIMLAMLHSIYEGNYRTALHDFSGRYQRNTRLEDWYAILTKVGYRMSSDERELLSGTHDCFK
jgi:ParB family chromosome partitioning protein